MTQIAQMLQTEFKLTPIASYNEINQNGTYLIFRGLQAKEPNINAYDFSIIVVANSLMRDKDSLLPIIEDLEQKLFLKSAEVKQIWLKSITSGFINSSLYAYSLNLTIEKRREQK